MNSTRAAARSPRYCAPTTVVAHEAERVGISAHAPIYHARCLTQPPHCAIAALSLYHCAHGFVSVPTAMIAPVLSTVFPATILVPAST